MGMKYGRGIRRRGLNLGCYNAHNPLFHPKGSLAKRLPFEHKSSEPISEPRINFLSPREMYRSTFRTDVYSNVDEGTSEERRCGGDSTFLEREGITRV